MFVHYSQHKYMGGHDLSDRGEEKTDLLAQGKPGIISCTFFSNQLPT